MQDAEFRQNYVQQTGENQHRQQHANHVNEEQLGIIRDCINRLGKQESVVAVLAVLRSDSVEGDEDRQRNDRRGELKCDWPHRRTLVAGPGSAHRSSHRLERHVTPEKSDEDDGNATVQQKVAELPKRVPREPGPVRHDCSPTASLNCCSRTDRSGMTPAMSTPWLIRLPRMELSSCRL